MITYKEKLDKKSKEEIQNILKKYPDYYSDFYITHHNMRIFLKENIQELYKCVNKNKDKVIYNTNGVILTYGLNSKYRTYLKIIGEDITDLLKALLWNINTDLYVKLKKKNPILHILNQYNFKVVGYRGKELLLKRSK